MTTFSQMVDTLVAESRRGDMLAEICTYLNQSIRDVHFNASNNSLIAFDSNLQEAVYYADVDDSFVVPIDRPHLFARLEVVYYVLLDDYAVERKPSTIANPDFNSNLIWYRTGENLAFGGYGGIGAPIKLAWLGYPRNLRYYKTTVRPATWNEETEQWSYLPAFDIDPTTRANALDLSTNWLLQRWQHAIMEGVRAKLYKRLSDEGRMRAAYSSFENARKALVAAESYEHVPIFYK